MAFFNAVGFVQDIIFFKGTKMQVFVKLYGMAIKKACKQAAF